VGPAPILIEAVVFDMDGVLIDSEPLWRSVERERLGTVGVDLTDDDLMQTMGVPIHEVVGMWHRRHPWQEPTPKELAEDIVGRVAQAIARGGDLREGAVDAVGYFRGLGVRLAVASSSPRRLIDAVLALGLPAEWFDVILSGDGSERGKPDPAIYLSAARELGVAPERCLAVEDSLNGVRSAKAAGMVCVAIPEAPPVDGRFDRADLVLGSLHELDGRVWPATGTMPTLPRC
jgi:mannitol-1-/sugar-/sorbitol-6-/2-deoxyglucose-6-phosphatase